MQKKKMSNLTVWRLPESLGWPKKMQKRRMVRFLTKKDLKSKNVRGDKVYILAKDVITERKFEIKAKKVFCLKRHILCCTLIQAVEIN